MEIAHIAIWTTDLEKVKSFYLRYFKCRASPKYENKDKRFESYFIDFDGNCKIELMRRADIKQKENESGEQHLGLIHFAISVGSEEAVNAITESIKKEGHKVVSSPRNTGDGYYESCVLDPEGNRVEITI